MFGIQTCFYWMIRKEYQKECKALVDQTFKVNPLLKSCEPILDSDLKIEKVAMIYKSLGDLISRNFFWKVSKGSKLPRNTFHKWIGHNLQKTLIAATAVFFREIGIEVEVRNVKGESSEKDECKSRETRPCSGHDRLKSMEKPSAARPCKQR